MSDENFVQESLHLQAVLLGNLLRWRKFCPTKFCPPYPSLSPSLLILGMLIEFTLLSNIHG